MSLPFPSQKPRFRPKPAIANGLTTFTVRQTMRRELPTCFEVTQSIFYNPDDYALTAWQVNEGFNISPTNNPIPASD
jgi:hypothetical protein